MRSLLSKLVLGALLLSPIAFQACEESGNPLDVDGDVSALVVTGVNGMLEAGEEVQLTVTGRTASGGNASVDDCTLTFTSSNEAVATVSGDGMVEAMGPGSATITVRCDTVVATTVVLVTDGTATAHLTLDNTTAQLRVGDSIRLRASIQTEGGLELEGVDASFSSSNNAVATVSSSGVVRAQGAGTATITASHDGKIAAMVVTVLQVQNGQSITVDPPAATLTANGTVQLDATVRDANGTVVQNADVTFTSSAEAVATVDDDGLVTAHATGTATITARSSAGATATATIVVVAEGGVGEVELTPPDLTLRVGGSADLNATIRNAQGGVMTDGGVVFTSDDDTIAVVTSTGLVIGLRAGNTTIRARAGGETDTTVVTVVN